MRRTPSAMRRGMATRSMMARGTRSPRASCRAPGARLLERLLEQQRPEDDVVEGPCRGRASSRRSRRACARSAAPPPSVASSSSRNAASSGQEDGHRAHLPEQPHRAVGRPAAQQAEDLLEDAGARRLAPASSRRRDHGVVDVRGDARGRGGAANLMARRMRIGSSRKRTIGSPMVWIARRVDVVHAAAPVEDLPAVEVVEERVDREVAPERVLVGLAEDVVAADEEVVDARPTRPRRARPAGCAGRSRPR